MLTFQGIHAKILEDQTSELSIEGGRSTGKSTVLIWKELEALKKYPGMWSFAFRYSDTDNKTKLRPEIERICALRNEFPAWNSTEMCYEFENKSKLFSYGLKSADMLSRYAKLRGLAVSRVYCDQAEELPEDVATEIRFGLRPDATARSKGQDFPRQLVFGANPLSTRHWLAEQFPEDQRYKHRRYYSLTLYDNKHNLPDDQIQRAEAAYPPDHPRHRMMIMGKRGPNVVGTPIYQRVYSRETHERPVSPHSGQLIEAFFTGKSHPTWVIAQRTRGGSLQFIGGIIGIDLFLTDFLPIVKEISVDWFGANRCDRLAADASIKTASAPSGNDDESIKFTDMDIMRSHGFKPIWRENSNSPETRVSMMEYLADAMRRRTFTGEEGIAVNDAQDRWLEASREGIKPCPFLAEAFHVGYVREQNQASEPAFVSVGHKQVRQAKADNWFELGMHCAEYLVLNFCAGRKSEAEKDRDIAKAHATARTMGLRVLTGPDSWLQ